MTACSGEMREWTSKLRLTQPQLQHAGRGDRVARTREAIVASALTLAMDGEVAPIVRDIAKLAGVSARTVFQHFADTAELYVAVLGRVLAAVRRRGARSRRGSWPLDERISDDDRPARRPLREAAADVDLRRDAAAPLVGGGRQVAQMYTANREQLADWFDQELTTLPRENARADAERAGDGAGAGELDRAARAARPHGRSGARRSGASSSRAIFTRREPAARSGRRRASSSRARSRKPSSRRCATRVAHIVDVGAGGARALAHQRQRPWRAAACRRTGDARGRRDRPAPARCGRRRDGSAGRLLDVDAVILDLARPQIAAHRVVVLGRQAMGEAAAGAARQQAEDQAGLLRRAAIMLGVDAEGAVEAVQACRLASRAPQSPGSTSASRRRRPREAGPLLARRRSARHAWWRWISARRISRVRVNRSNSLSPSPQRMARCR